MGRVRLPGPHRVHAEFSRPPPRSTPAASCLIPPPGHYPAWPTSARLPASITTTPALPRRRSPLTQLASLSPLLPLLLLSPPSAALLLHRAMNILNQPINPGGHPVFPAAKESGFHADARQLTPASVRFDGPSTAAAGRWSHAHSPRWQAQTLRRASSYVGAEHDGTTAAAVPAAGPAPPFKPLTLDFLRSFLDRNGCEASSVVEAEDSVAPPRSPPPPLPPQVLALRVVVTSALELDARQTELIARKMRRITGFVNLKLENVVDPSLIAGFVVCYGTDDSHVIDLSVKGKLAALKNRVDAIDQSAHESPHQMV